MRKLLLCFFVVFMLGFVVQAQAMPLVNGLGGVGFGENSLARNDDSSTGFLNTSSVFSGGLNFFGTVYNGFYLNNNGNITFSSPLSTYTPYALTGATGNPIIAAYFADVDTRAGVVTPTAGGNSLGNNLLYYDFDTVSGKFSATWDDVGYYSYGTNRLNAFQLILTDQLNGDFDIEFIYESIDWTTGRASGGSDGLGGTISRAGWNSGNGTNYYELPQSGDQSAMLALESASNINDPGHFLFRVRNGQVLPDNNGSVVPEPASMLLWGIGLAGASLMKRKNEKKGKV